MFQYRGDENENENLLRTGRPSASGSGISQSQLDKRKEIDTKKELLLNSTSIGNLALIS